MDIHWGKWHKNITIRKVPYSRYYQKAIAKIYYKIWIFIDNPNFVFINFLYHGESSLPKRIKYYYILHSPERLVPHRYEYIKRKLVKFNNLNFIPISRLVKFDAEKSIKSNILPIIYNGVDTNYFNKKNTDNNDGVLKLITLSALEKRKGIQYIINAIRFIKCNSVKYSIYGDGPYYEELNELIHYHKLENTVYIYGGTNNVKKLLHNSDVYCLPSKGEAFPLGPLEAMACGLPIIVSDSPPYDEFVNDRVGIKVSVDSMDSIVGAINNLKNKRLRRKMGNAGREYVQKNYSVEIMASNYYKLISGKESTN